MQEPTYEYVKGEGWVVQTHAGPILTMHCGTKVRLELRNPKEGEHYMCCLAKNLDPLALFIERCSYQHYEYRIICDGKHDAYHKYTYCVLVPV